MYHMARLSVTGVLLDDHHPASELYDCFPASRTPVKQPFSSRTICYYKREETARDLLTFHHFASGIGLLKVRARAVTSGVRGH